MNTHGFAESGGASKFFSNSFAVCLGSAAFAAVGAFIDANIKKASVMLIILMG